MRSSNTKHRGRLMRHNSRQLLWAATRHPGWVPAPVVIQSIQRTSDAASVSQSSLLKRDTERRCGVVQLHGDGPVLATRPRPAIGGGGVAGHFPGARGDAADLAI